MVGAPQPERVLKGLRVGAAAFLNSDVGVTPVANSA